MSESVSRKENGWHRMKSNPLEICAEYLKMNWQKKERKKEGKKERKKGKNISNSVMYIWNNGLWLPELWVCGMNSLLTIQLSAFVKLIFVWRRNVQVRLEKNAIAVCMRIWRGVWEGLREDLLFLKSKKVYRNNIYIYMCVRVCVCVCVLTHLCTCMYVSTDVKLVWIFHY